LPTDYANGERHAAGKTYAPSTPSQPPVEKYTVQKGDTLSQIAKDAGISLNELKDLNPKFTSDPKYKNGNMIWSGTKVNLPGKAAPIEETVKDPIIEPPTFQGPFSGDPGIIFTPTVPAIPITLPPPPPPPPTTYKVKVATPEIILFDDETLPVETLTDILFEDIGGQELLSMSRHDIVSGNYIPNQLIKNLTSLNQEFSSKRLLSLQNTSDKYFSNFGIKLENKVPFIGNGLNGENVYLDEFQNVIIELVNLDIDEQVEVQLSIGGTMYTIMLGVVES
jgi:LysM repeat protein